MADMETRSRSQTLFPKLLARPRPSIAACRHGIWCLIRIKNQTVFYHYYYRVR